MFSLFHERQVDWLNTAQGDKVPGQGGYKVSEVSVESNSYNQSGYKILGPAVRYMKQRRQKLQGKRADLRGQKLEARDSNADDFLTTKLHY